MNFPSRYSFISLRISDATAGLSRSARKVHRATPHFYALATYGGLALLAVAILLLTADAAPARDPFFSARQIMVERDIVGSGIENPLVIEAMRETPRHEFVSLAHRRNAYYDMALPIGESQTISSPFIVAFMTESLDPQPTDKVLEIGTGSGYQAAVLSSLVHKVYTIEIVAPLGRQAEKTLKRLRYDNVHVKIGDGYQGWPQYAPFDKIIVTCSPEKVPGALVRQLREGGRMVVPVGERYQQTLYLFTKRQGKLIHEALRPTLFVPMTGRAESRRQVQPDATQPEIRNGGFEEVTGDPPAPTGWHYQRQLEWIEADDAPEGDYYARFTNEEGGRSAQALQGFAVDGRAVRNLDVSAWIRLDDVRPGRDPRQLPAMGVTFYDEKRAPLKDEVVGPWLGTYDWQPQSRRIPVPPRAREAVMRIGMLGATGEMCVDKVELKAAPGR